MAAVHRNEAELQKEKQACVRLDAAAAQPQSAGPACGAEWTERNLGREEAAEEHGTGAAEAERQCRICHTGGSGLFSPCMCKGSHQWVHESCLQEWRVKSSRADSYHTCELCQYQYTVARTWWATALDHPRAQLLLTQVCMHVGASAWMDVRITRVCAVRERASEREYSVYSVACT